MIEVSTRSYKIGDKRIAVSTDKVNCTIEITEKPNGNMLFKINGWHNTTLTGVTKTKYDDLVFDANRSA